MGQLIRTLLIISLGFISAAFFTTALVPAVSATIEDLTVNTGCTTVPSYTGERTVKQGTYDVFVRLAKRGERAKVAGYFKESDSPYGQCHALRTVQASGDSWTRVGTMAVPATDKYILQLASPSLASLPDANRPSVMIVSHQNPICVPTTECAISIGSIKGYVRPTSNLLNQDSLHVLQVENPATDQVHEVRYYVDDKLVYTTKQLEEFDSRYLSYPGQQLSRVIEYDSGQQIVLDSTASDEISDNLGKFMFRLGQHNPTLLIVASVALFAALIGGLLRALIYRTMQRQAWREHHGFAEHKLTVFDRIGFFISGHRLMRWLRIGLDGVVVIFLAFGLIVTTYTYVLQTATVEGHSMERQYHTGDQVLVDKFAKTMATINNLEYMPKRGDVVVVNAVFGNAKLSSENTTNLLLIKRVLALPGERVIVKSGVLRVYNEKHPEGFVPDQGSSWQATMTPDVPSEYIDVTLSKSELFVSGDNRPASIDSRFNGPIATKEVVGRVIARW